MIFFPWQLLYVGKNVVLDMSEMFTKKELKNCCFCTSVVLPHLVEVSNIASDHMSKTHESCPKDQKVLKEPECCGTGSLSNVHGAWF